MIIRYNYFFHILLRIQESESNPFNIHKAESESMCYFTHLCPIHQTNSALEVHLPDVHKADWNKNAGIFFMELAPSYTILLDLFALNLISEYDSGTVTSICYLLMTSCAVGPDLWRCSCFEILAPSHANLKETFSKYFWYLGYAMTYSKIFFAFLLVQSTCTKLETFEILEKSRNLYYNISLHMM